MPGAIAGGAVLSPNEMRRPEAEQRLRTRTLGDLKIYNSRRPFDEHGHLSFTIELAYYPPYHSKYNPIEVLGCPGMSPLCPQFLTLFCLLFRNRACP
jgi:hypothetical protein